MPNCRYSQTIAIFFTKRRTPLKCDTILKRPHSLLKCILEPEVVTSYSLLKCILKPEVVTTLWGYARPMLNWWLNWYSPVITSVITKPYLKIVSEMSSPNSLVKCYHQNHYWNVITKFVSEMSSPKSLLKCHHQMIQIMLWKCSLLESHHQRQWRHLLPLKCLGDTFQG